MNKKPILSNKLFLHLKAPSTKLQKTNKLQIQILKLCDFYINCFEFCIFKIVIYLEFMILNLEFYII